MQDFLDSINGVIRGPYMLVLLVGTGIYLTIRLKLIQIFKLPLALKLILKAPSQGTGEIISFGALCTALAATVGTGNIVGINGADQGHYSGYGWLPFLEWLLNTPRVYLQLNIVR